MVYMVWPGVGVAKIAEERIGDWREEMKGLGKERLRNDEILWILRQASLWQSASKMFQSFKSSVMNTQRLTLGLFSLWRISNIFMGLWTGADPGFRFGGAGRAPKAHELRGQCLLPRKFFNFGVSECVFWCCLWPTWVWFCSSCYVDGYDNNDWVYNFTVIVIIVAVLSVGSSTTSRHADLV